MAQATQGQYKDSAVEQLPQEEPQDMAPPTGFKTPSATSRWAEAPEFIPGAPPAPALNQWGGAPCGTPYEQVPWQLPQHSDGNGNAPGAWGMSQDSHLLIIPLLVIVFMHDRNQSERISHIYILKIRHEHTNDV